MLYFYLLCFFCMDTAPTEIYTYVHTLSLHDSLPIWSVLLVHDGYPEALVAVGMMSPDSILARTMSRVMKATFAAYDRVVLLGEDMARLIAEAGWRKGTNVDHSELGRCRCDSCRCPLC